MFLKSVPKLLLGLGTISYSLYLFHPLVMRVFSQMTNKYALLQGYHLSFYMVFTALLSIIVAFIVYIIVEKPAINLGHHLTRDK